MKFLEVKFNDGFDFFCWCYGALTMDLDKRAQSTEFKSTIIGAYLIFSLTLEAKLKLVPKIPEGHRNI